MSHSRTRGRVLLSSFAVLSLIVIVPVVPTQGATVADTPVVTVGADIPQLDTDTEHTTQGPGDLTQLQAFNSPVGDPDAGGWHQRDPQLRPSAGSGAVIPANQAFDLSVASTSVGPALATLTNEAGTTLTAGLASVAGLPLAAVSGQLAGNLMTYSAVVTTPATAPVTATTSTITTITTTPSTTTLATAATTGITSNGVDAIVRSTVQGVDLGVIMHTPDVAGPVAFTLATDAQGQFVQSDNGVLQVIHTMTDYGDDGTPFTDTTPEFVIDTPRLLDSSANPTAPVSTGPVTTTLTETGSGQLLLNVNVDQAWLHASTRTFPVELDIPISTATAADETGWFGTVNSCAPTTPALVASLLVGTEGSCTYHGVVYFDVSSLSPDTPIVAATLHLYAPNHPDSTGVQVFQNTSPSSPDWQPLGWNRPSWATAPTIEPGAAGISENGGASPWKTWDVTGLVQRWVAQSDTNGGLTLASSNAPVLFAWPLGAANNDPTLAPYIDITYATVPSGVDTGATPHYIYGVSGGFTASDSTNTCALTELVCAGKIKVRTVAYDQQHAPTGLGAQYFRFDATLDCNNPQPGPGWWNNKAAEGNQDSGSIGQLVQRAAQIDTTAKAPLRLVPILDLTPDGTCPSYFTPTIWSEEAENLVDYINFWKYPTTDEIDFEIGNEPNIHPSEYVFGPYKYSDLFKAAAQGLQTELAKYGYTNYHIITGGMLNPTAVHDPTCEDTTKPYPGFPPFYNIDWAKQAIQAATAAGITNLAVGVHPYHYNTTNMYYFRNFYALGNKPANPCGYIDKMINMWSGIHSGSQTVPIFFTEDNWSDHPCPDHGPVFTGCKACPTSTVDACEGTYLVDLFTYMKDKYFPTTKGTDRFRVLWYRGADALDTYVPPKAPPDAGAWTGIYRYSGSPKFAYIGQCPKVKNVVGTPAISQDYLNLRYQACY